jgi:hypothetical protein
LKPAAALADCGPIAGPEPQPPWNRTIMAADMAHRHFAIVERAGEARAGRYAISWPTASRLPRSTISPPSMARIYWDGRSPSISMSTM